MDEATIAELIAIGASAAANCDTCLRYHAKRAAKLGAAAEDISSAVRIGLMVKHAPHRRLISMAERLGIEIDEAGDEGTNCCEADSDCCCGDGDGDRGTCCPQ